MRAPLGLQHARVLRLVLIIALTWAAFPRSIGAQCVGFPLNDRHNSARVAFFGTVQQVQMVPAGQIVTFIVSRVRMMFHRGNLAFRRAAPSGRLDELATRCQDVQDDSFITPLRETPFDRDGMPRLIFVATDIDEPYELIEGTKRSVTILRRSETGAVRVCLGVGDRWPDWSSLTGEKSS
jgi:hypothetical protein